MEAKTPKTPQELEKALFFAQEAFSRALLPFFPMGQTALNIKNDEWLKGEKISLGVKAKDYSGAAHIFPEAVRIAGGSNIDIRDKKIHIEFEGVPIEVRIITKHYKVLDFLNPVFYAYDTFYLPNPFDHFWRMHVYMH